MTGLVGKRLAAYDDLIETGRTDAADEHLAWLEARCLIVEKSPGRYSARSIPDAWAFFTAQGGVRERAPRRAPERRPEHPALIAVNMPPEGIATHDVQLAFL